MTDQTLHDEMIERSERYLLPLYKRVPLALVRGEGVWVYDADGRRYLDGIAGIAVNALGHGHPAVVAAIQQAATGLLHTSNLYYTAPAAELAERLIVLTPWASKVFVCNSGTEAVEAALKFARRRAYALDAGNKTGLVACQLSFHGRTMGALSVTGRKIYRTPFEPLVPDVSFLTIDASADDIAHVVTPNTAAVIVEPILGEGGILVPDDTFLHTLRQRCDAVDALLIFDEIQCGLGRTGDIWAHTASGVEPDIMTVAKPLGGGLPIGAVLLNERAASAINYGDHGSTFAGNALVCAVANVVLEHLADPALLSHVRQVGTELGAALRDLGERYEQITDVRGRGLMWGLEFAGGEAPAVYAAAHKHGLLLAGAGADALRITPSLIISSAEVQELVQRLDRALDQATA